MNESPETAELRLQINDLRGKLQEQARQLAETRSLLQKVVEASDQNATTFRDTIQILDAKSCVQEAIIRDLAADLCRTFVPSGPDHSYTFQTKYKAVGGLDVAHYFNQWRQKLVEEEAKTEDPYEGAVVFGGDYAKVDESPG